MRCCRKKMQGFISKSAAALDNLPRRGYNIKVEYAPVCWNWQTRRTQNPLVVTPYGFDPHHRHKNKFPQLYPGWGTYFYFPVLRGRTARSRRSGTQISPVGCLRGRGRPPSPAFLIPKPFFVMNLFEFILIFDLSIDELYGIISAIKFIGKPGASRRRKAIGTHWVSQLPARNCCFFCHQ